MKVVDLKTERERKRRAANTETILHAAEAVILRKGPGAMTMDDVARESQFAKATLYQYFPGRAELVDRIVLHYYEDVRDLIERIVSRDLPAAEKLRGVILTSIEFHDAKENISRVLMTDGAFRDRMLAFAMGHTEGLSAADKRLCRDMYAKIRGVLDVCAAILADGVRTGEFRDMDVRAAVAYLAAVIQGMFHIVVQSIPKLSPRERTDIIMEFLMKGIAAAPGPAKGESI